MAAVDSRITFADRLGGWKVRWGIGRMKYLVPPGLYAVGSPGPADPVAVTANYKMSYDMVRQSLQGRNIWLLVLETHGINVWCAAGKGTFGTEELVKRVVRTGLEKLVNHRVLLLPLYGATGVAAHVVKQQTGFTVKYTVPRAADLPRYLDNGMSPSPDMREITFTLRERLALVPMELVEGVKKSIPLFVIFFLLGAWTPGQFSLTYGLTGAGVAMIGVLAGTVGVPLFLPSLPTGSFAIKGAFAGGAVMLSLSLLRPWDYLTTATFLAVPAISGFWGLNFTGSTPFTSQSGVKKEMRIGLPIMVCALIAALFVWISGRFFGP